jgi:methionyl-tRNA formyltransferase
LKILEAEAQPHSGTQEPPGVALELREPGRPRRLGVATGRGILILRTVAPEGRTPVSGESFLNGYRQILGARLG